MNDVKEWEKRNADLLERMHIFEKKYKKKYCSKKTSTHVRSGCHEFNGEVFCPALKKAKMRKFKKEIEMQIALASRLTAEGSN